MATIALLVVGALVNAHAFSESNFLFSKLRSSQVDAERKPHDMAIEQLQSAQAAWVKKQTERLDFINEHLRRQRHAEHTFWDVDEAMSEYYILTGKFGLTSIPLTVVDVV